MIQGKYKLSNPEYLDTPAMLTYPHLVEHNIDEIIRICSSSENVVPHAKTHKSSDILNMQLAKGIKSYKCATLKEAEVVRIHDAFSLNLMFSMIAF